MDFLNLNINRSTRSIRFGKRLEDLLEDQLEFQTLEDNRIEMI